MSQMQVCFSNAPFHGTVPTSVGTAVFYFKSSYDVTVVEEPTFAKLSLDFGDFLLQYDRNALSRAKREERRQ